MEIDLKESLTNLPTNNLSRKILKAFGSKINLQPGNIYFLSGVFWNDNILPGLLEADKPVRMKKYYNEQFLTEDSELFPFLFLGAEECDEHHREFWRNVYKLKGIAKSTHHLKFLFYSKTFSIPSGPQFADWVIDDCQKRVKKVLMTKYYAPELLEGNFSNENIALCYKDLRKEAERGDDVKSKNLIWLY